TPRGCGACNDSRERRATADKFVLLPSGRTIPFDDFLMARWQRRICCASWSQERIRRSPIATRSWRRYCTSEVCPWPAEPSPSIARRLAFFPRASAFEAPLPRTWRFWLLRLELRDSRNNLAPHDLQRLDPMRIWDRADHGLDAHPSQPAQLSDQLACLGAIVADCEAKCTGLLNRLVVATLRLTVSTQHLQFVWDFWCRAQAAC